MFFTEKEEEFAQLLIEIGTKKNIANVLVYLANIREAASRDIERGTDLRQPEVSIALRYLTDQGWIASREDKAPGKGRPIKIYRLTKPVGEIMDTIEKDKREEAEKRLQHLKKLRDYLP